MAIFYVHQELWFIKARKVCRNASQISNWNIIPARFFWSFWALQQSASLNRCNIDLILGTLSCIRWGICWLSKGNFRPKHSYTHGILLVPSYKGLQMYPNKTPVSLELHNDKTQKRQRFDPIRTWRKQGWQWECKNRPAGNPLEFFHYSD